MRIFREQGFTLIEVAVSLLILSLITVAVVGIYNSGIFAIIFSGERTAAVYEAQTALDKAIYEEEEGDEHHLAITFQAEDGTAIEIEVKGRVVTKESEEGYGLHKRKVSASVFIPEEVVE